MEKKLKSWQGWLLFGGSMVVVFVLGLCVSALMERRAEVASIFNNRKNVIKGIEARNELFKNDFPREYQTWTETAKTDFESEFNGNIACGLDTRCYRMKGNYLRWYNVDLPETMKIRSQLDRKSVV